MESIGYLNGQFLPHSQLLIPVDDRGFHFGDTVYDVERTFSGKVFRLREHMERLHRSLAAVCIDPGLSMAEMERLTLEVIERNEPIWEHGSDYTIRQFVTRGVGSHTLQQGPPSVGIYVAPIPFQSFARWYQTGAPVVIPRTRTYATDSLDPKVKHYSRMNFVLAELEAGATDPEAYPVLLDTYGNLAENTRMNFFIVSRGVIRTSTSRAILEGISRMTVLELARQLGIPAVEEDLQPYDAYNADEAFLTATRPCVLPVASIDGRPVRHAVPGPITKQLWAAWSELVGMDFVAQALSQAPKAATAE